MHNSFIQAKFRIPSSPGFGGSYRSISRRVKRACPGHRAIARCLNPGPSNGPLWIADADRESYAFAVCMPRKGHRKPETRHGREVLDTTYSELCGARIWFDENCTDLGGSAIRGRLGDVVEVPAYCRAGKCVPLCCKARRRRGSVV